MDTSFNRIEASAFLEPLLHRSRAEGTQRDLRGLGHGSPATLYSAHVGRCVGFIERCVVGAKNAYIGTLSRGTASSKASAVAGYDAVWADIDCGAEVHVARGHDTKGDALDAIAGLAVSPTFVVDSGYGIHVWFLLQRRIEFTRWRSLIERLNVQVRGDLAAVDPARILRIPGTTNFKRDPVPVRLLKAGAEVRVENLEAAIDEVVPRIVPPARPHDARSPLSSRRCRRASGSPFDEANDVPVAAVLQRLGVATLHERGARTYCGCPVCPGPDHEEMVVGGSRNVAHCFGDCRRSFTNVDLVCAVLRLPPRAAVDWLAEAFGLSGFPR